MAKVKLNFPLREKKEIEKIVVWSAKGGVGKTTISIALASFIAEKEKVGLLDADITCPNVMDYLNIDEKLVGSREENLIYPVRRGNLEVVSMGGIIESDLPWRGVMLSKAVEDFINRVDWKAKKIIIDAPPGTSDVMISLSSLGIDKAILITTPSKLALKDLERSLSFLRRFKIKVIGIIENMVEERSIREELEKKGERVICSIKKSKEIEEKIEKGESIHKIERKCFEKIWNMLEDKHE